MSAILAFGAEGQLGARAGRARRPARHGDEVGWPRRGRHCRRRSGRARDRGRIAGDRRQCRRLYQGRSRGKRARSGFPRQCNAAPASSPPPARPQAIPLLHVSTDYVFDGTKATAYVEDDPIAPLGVYGRSKAEGEAAVRRVLEHHVILRTSWVYGVYGANFLKTVLRLARERDELRIVADQRGCPTGTADIAEAILAIAPPLARREPVWGTYHFAGQGVTTWHGFASEIVDAQAADHQPAPAVVPISTAEYPTAAQRPANSELDSSRFAATFGIKAKDWRERTRQVTAALLS